MNTGSPYGWLFFAAFGLGLFLSSLVRKGRKPAWIMAGLSLFLIALGGAFIFTDFIVPDFLRNRVLPFYLPLTVFFFIVSWRLAFLGPLFLLLVSLVPIIWGSSGNYSLEKGVYPVKITNYPAGPEGRSYLVEYADGRESAVTGCGDYLAVERISWDWRLFFMTSREYPVGFENQDGQSLVPLTMDQPRPMDRPGIRRETVLVGPIRDELFYTWHLERNEGGNLILTSLDPRTLP